jgi:very-short-patch-repair endonuclease
MLVVEVDGATHSTPREMTHDAERTRVLELLGFHILRVSNEDVSRNLPGVLDAILFTLDPP